MDLLETIDSLQTSIVLSGNDEVNAILSDGISSLNGLTDGWALLLQSLDLIQLKFKGALTKQQATDLAVIQKAVKKMVYRT